MRWLLFPLTLLVELPFQTKFRRRFLESARTRASSEHGEIAVLCIVILHLKILRCGVAVSCNQTEAAGHERARATWPYFVGRAPGQSAGSVEQPLDHVAAVFFEVIETTPSAMF